MQYNDIININIMEITDTKYLNFQSRQAEQEQFIDNGSVIVYRQRVNGVNGSTMGQWVTKSDGSHGS